MDITRSKKTMFVLLLVTASWSFSADQKATVPVQEHTLANGLKLLLVQRHFSPTVSAGWVARAGSVNESAGATGTAHLIEHMMFKGTRTVGTRQGDREAEMMSQIDSVRDQMDHEYERLRDSARRGEIDGGIDLPANATPRMADLRTRMAELQTAHRALIVKEEYDQIYTTAGASGINAGTAADYTMYFVTVPANKLELWFWMESDRLLDPVFREFYVERKVVREERRTRVETDPTELFEEQFNSMFWSSLAYRHPTSGWPSDIVAIRRDQAREFFTTYYAPNNITAVLVGDFDAKRAVSLAETYFGRIRPRTSPPPPVVTDEIVQVAERRIHADSDTNPSVQIRWHAVPFVHADLPVFDLISDLLDGRAGRLYQSMVEEKGVAIGEPWAWVQPLRYSGGFEIGAEVAEGRSHEEVEAALLAEIERLKREPVLERELETVKNQNLANRFRGLRSNWELMYELLSSEGLGGWRYLNESPVKIRAVTPQRIADVARSHFPVSGKNVMWYFRREGFDRGASSAMEQ